MEVAALNDTGMHSDGNRLYLAIDANGRKASLSIPSFWKFVEEFLATKSHEWKNAKHRAQWFMTLPTYAAPLHALAIDKITTVDVLGVLRPIWIEKPETGSRLRGQIEAVLDAAKAAGHRNGENPAAWAGNLAHLLSKRTAGQSIAAVPKATRRKERIPSVDHSCGLFL